MKGKRFLGWLIIIIGIAVLLMDERHCDASRFMIFCFCLMTGLPLIEKQTTGRTNP
nr:MAG TPA: hypothetical protein [Caudoviricetes sp.]